MRNSLILKWAEQACARGERLALPQWTIRTLRLAAGFHGGYPTAWIDELLDEAGCDTLNLRLLWQDKVRGAVH